MAHVYAGRCEQGEDFEGKGVPNSDIWNLEITFEGKNEVYILRMNV
jgi:hypothetical protein